MQSAAESIVRTLDIMLKSNRKPRGKVYSIAMWRGKKTDNDFDDFDDGDDDFYTLMSSAGFGNGPRSGTFEFMAHI